MRLYIAGPMWGLPDFNTRRSFAPPTSLRALGTTHQPSPPRRPLGMPDMARHMRASLRDTGHCDGVHSSPRLGQLAGRALLERDIARGLDLPVKPLSEWLLLAKLSPKQPGRWRQ